MFEPVLTPGQIAEVEAQFGVVLPEEYRSFLAELGAGDPGPDRRLTSLLHGLR
ncbi:SMI1/KNR4 family protein [Streptomyces sp. enrichment culture]|uniref:SMI1/KNR4 family protein n=1 Tax=Streptomyces sp. enrichment culture TaxID=1795815 RepID=UPI003F5511BB